MSEQNGSHKGGKFKWAALLVLVLALVVIGWDKIHAIYTGTTYQSIDATERRLNAMAEGAISEKVINDERGF